MWKSSKAIPDLGQYDVIVVGSGSAGTPAAIAAARMGKTTLLIERLPFLGGTSTAVLDTFYGYYMPGKTSRRIIGGIANDVYDELQRLDRVIERPNTHGAGTAVTYHPEYLKVAWENLARQAGVKVILNGFVQDVIVDQDRITGLVLATIGGLRTVKGRVFVDATGDANLCHFAGFEYELAGELEPAQTLTTTFKMVNVDVTKRKTLSKEAFHSLMAEAADSGRYRLPRREGSDHITPVDHMTATIMTRLDSYQKQADGSIINASDPCYLSQAEQAGRLQAIEYIRFLRDMVPGYEHAQLATLGTTIGVRETRRVYGEYRLTRDDVLQARQFDDQIGLCGAPIEDHHGGTDTRWVYLPEGQCVGIPYRTLIPKGSENLFVAGRCFSATHDAHASVRSMGQCMVMGQAAGTAAAMCADQHITPLEINTDRLRHILLDQGAVLELS
ncbi:MAG: FAD-dependent oxidoreductase [Gammaproteobacteria bacterium]|nr:MAG: FAD-dependent oxidoreductase [Gammaproteobacteria bacterium]